MEGIRPLTEQDMADFHHLIHYAFKSSNTLEDPLVAPEPCHVLGYFIDGNLASSVYINPQSVYFQSNQLPCGIVAGVASWPEYRKTGTVGQLMRHSLEAMHRQGCLLSYLSPFSYSFYRKYGWEQIHEYKIHTLNQRWVPGWQGRGTVKRTNPDLPLLNGIYSRYARQFNGMLVRSEQRWTDNVLKYKPGTIAVYYDESGAPQGYMIYQITGDTCKIHEIVYQDSDSRNGLWEYVKRQDSMYEKVVFSTPADDPFAYLIDDVKHLETSLRPGIMGRIIDVKGFLERYRFPEDMKPETLRLHIADSCAPWNDGIWVVTIGDEGKAAVERADSGGDCLSCDISTLSAMLLGAYPPSRLRELERLNGQPEWADLWSRLAPDRPICYFDNAL